MKLFDDWEIFREHLIFAGLLALLLGIESVIVSPATSVIKFDALISILAIGPIQNSPTTNSNYTELFGANC